MVFKCNRTSQRKHYQGLYRIILIICLITGCNTFKSFAQASNIHFKHISEGSPIANTHVFDIIKDQNGFMWIATYTGLYRYDGYTYKPYSSDIGDGSNAPSGPVRSLFIDHLSRLWMCVTGNGIWVKDNKNKFQKVYPDSAHGFNAGQSIMEDKEGNIWVGTDKRQNGVIKLSGCNDLRKIKVRIYKAFDFCYITIDQDNNVWFICNGLYKLDRSKDSFINIHDKKLGSYFYRSIFTDHSKTIWISNVQGVFKFNPTNMIVTSLFEDLNINTRDYKDLNGFGSMIEDKKGGYWLASFQGLLSIRKNQLKLYQHKQSDPDILISNEIHKLYLDDKNILWVCTANGLEQVLTSSFTKYNSVNYNGKDISLNDVRCSYVDKQGTIWLGSKTNGLVKITTDQKVEITKLNYSEFLQSDPNCINTILADQNGNLWVAGPTGINKFDVIKNKFVFHHSSRDWQTVALLMWSLCEDKDGSIWIGTKSEGIVNFNPNNHKLSFYNDRSSGYAAWCIYRDKHDNIWVGTDSGLCKLIKKNGHISLKRYPNYLDGKRKAPGQNIWHILEDKDGQFWIATSDGGLLHFNPENGQFKTYSMKDGLPSNMVSAVLEDKEGTLWVSTVNGLCHFDPKRGKAISTYYKEDGLNSSQFSFKSCNKVSDSLMIFGDITGFSMFNPSKIVEKKSNAPLMITSCRVLSNNNWIELNTDTTLLLSHEQNSVNIEFASLNFTDPLHNQYAYQFSGADSTWVNCGTQHQVSFGNLRPGNYIFKVRAINTDGTRLPQMALLTFIIKPPFWETWWFLSLVYIVIISIVTYILYSVIKDKNTKRHKIQSELALLRTQLNPHFVFSSLSSLQQFITSHDQEAALEYLSNFARLMRNILEYSKNELVDLEQEVNFIRLFTEMESVRINNKVKLIIEKDFPVSEPEPQIPPMIMQPLIENSLKHGMISKIQGGYIKIRFEKEGKNLKWTIEDNGIGRVAASANRSKTEGKHNSLSMNIIKDRLRLFAKKAKSVPYMSITDLYNENGEATGTRIELRMPLIYKPNIS